MTRSDGSYAEGTAGAGVTLYLIKEGSLKPMLRIAAKSKANNSMEAEMDAALIACAVLTLMLDYSQAWEIKKRIMTAVEDRPYVDGVVHHLGTDEMIDMALLEEARDDDYAEE